MRAFISSQFGYCPLVWFFCSRKVNNRMNRIQERDLRIVHKDYVSTFVQLLEKDNSVSIHIRNLQLLTTEFLRQGTIYLLLYFKISLEQISLEIFYFTGC